MRTEQRWFLPQPSAAPARFRLFCFPYAGGAASIFARWSHELPAGVDLYAVQLPGRQNRLAEPAFRRLSDLVERLAAVMEPYCDLPFGFFGHSMGALISFELCRRLRRQGATLPRYLFVSGRRAPQLVDRNAPLHQLPDRMFLQVVARLGGLPAAVRHDPELMRVVLPTLRADFEVCETYVYAREEPLPCPILALGGTRDPLVPPPDLVAWQAQTRGAFESQLFEGGHFYFVEGVQEMLRHISQRIVQRAGLT